MLGKSAKQATKTGKTRSLEMAREMWQSVADASSKADTLGLTTPIAEGCRLLASRANYYLGEPENKHGRVRGELTCKEWTAFQYLVTEFSDAAPPLKALAQALGECGIDQPLIVRGKAGPKNQDKLARQDVETICNPESLQFLLSVLDRMVMLTDHTVPPISKETEKALGKLNGVTAQQMWKETLANIRSARHKLRALLEKLLKSDGRAAASLLMSTAEARLVCGMLSTFKDAAHAVIPPDRAEEKKEIERLLESAMRFFTRIGDEGVAKKRLE